MFPKGAKDGAFFLGVGDHGGAVTKAQIKQILAMQGDPTLPELRWSTLHEFFASLEATMPIDELPVVKGGLQHHARGCYSACGEEKYQNRRAEHQLLRAESTALINSLSVGRSYPGTQFADGWARLLFTQFHDTLAGTALYSDYQDARDAIGLACQTSLESRNADLLRLAKQVDLRTVTEGAVFAYNSLPWGRKALLEFYYQTNATNNRYTYLQAEDGGKVALQMRPSKSMTNFYPRLAAWVELPPCGYKVFTLQRDTPPPAQAFPPIASVSQDAFGLKSLRADDGAELLSTSLALIAIEDTSDTWAHGVDSFRKELGRPTFVSSEVVESGTAIRVTRQTLKWQSSDIVLDIAEYTATNVIELQFVIHWREHEQILMLEVPVAMAAPKVFVKVAGAAIQRDATGNEEPCHDWIALEGSINGREYTLALVNNETYSYDCLDGKLRTILIRSAPYARHNPNPVRQGSWYAWQDQGRQERTFWLLRGQGPYTSLSLDRRATELQAPAEHVLDSRHNGTRRWEESFLEIGPNNVEVLALKQAEQGNSVIIRVQESAGTETKARIHFPSLKVSEEIALSPWEIKTVSISHDEGKSVQVKTVSIMEE